MQDDPAIRLWLNDVSDGPPDSHVAIDESEATSRKRKPSQQRASSVSTEGYTENLSAISKKRKIDNPHLTFRAEDMKTGTMHNPPSRPSLESSELSEAITTKTMSESSIFWGEMRRLPADDAGLGYQELNVDAPPPVAADLVQRFGEISKGIGILPHESKEDITSHVQQQSWNLQPWKMAFLEKGDESNAALPGSVPAWEDVFNLCLRARDCFLEGHDGTSWKIEVHYELLKKIFRASGQGHDGSLDFMSCTTARPERTYLPRPWEAKLVDFCLFDNTDADSQARLDFISVTPARSVNHTGYRPLHRRPIVLSIETWRPEKTLDKKNLAMGVWHATQWSFLRSAVARKFREDDRETASKLAYKALRELGFIPGVIIHGHHWLFVFSTLESWTALVDGREQTVYRTVLWAGQEFGSTRSMRKAYQIVAGLRRLAGWATDVYMPWYRRHVLLIRDQDKDA
ncbi:uncharacterized protein NECHADRAFT_86344 [Fusarium vanettenii 77-13-4]|uniref:PD-(D/E)XK nuclease-like domain-containing protein n=1 Tax=Fusarium vanettenii (strain ATCC MYA-4622 / CBS 123669 / FGSC 9596 / NRRL 45880 / 77-13-4) TaxID=660122 RepID=C7ZEY8_FUSV7|nr:uncharacterized protein NECHADRAFT_86344 [Fusarium vanettenii 77-13-4]EEU37480.1 hypothetical protein NECHADRAFT_86344 [Fusarium vanettenii 77-13-4]